MTTKFNGNFQIEKAPGGGYERIRHTGNGQLVAILHPAGYRDRDGDHVAIVTLTPNGLEHDEPSGDSYEYVGMDGSMTGALSEARAAFGIYEAPKSPSRWTSSRRIRAGQKLCLGNQECALNDAVERAVFEGGTRVDWRAYPHCDAHEFARLEAGGARVLMASDLPRDWAQIEQLAAEGREVEHGD